MKKKKRYVWIKDIKKEIFSYFFIVSTYFIFREGINNIISVLFVKRWLGQVPFNLLILIIFFAWVGIILSFYNSKVKNKRRSNSVWLVVLFSLATAYVFDRIYFHYWDFFPLEWLIKYFDVFILIAIVSELINYRVTRGRNFDNINQSIFEINEPLDKIEDDNFNRDAFAIRISKEINNSYFDTAFSIGIVGEWSSGKSTFLNFLVGQLYKEKKLIIRFSPWSNIDSENTLSSFMKTIKQSLSKYDENFGPMLDNYQRAIGKMNDNIISNIVSSVHEIFKGNITLEEEIKPINKALERLNKQLIIIIDDLDRLDSREIIEVFKLIRNTGKFRNTIYITAFDRAYVTNALREFNDFNPHVFIDKIFDYEYVLPPHDTDYLRENFNRFSEELLGGIFKLDKSSHEAKIFEIFIRNDRDLHRLTTHLQIGGFEIARELVPADLFILELVRTRYPQILTYFHTRKGLFLGDPIIRKMDHELTLQYKGETTSFEQYLMQNELHSNNRFHISSEQITQILTAFKYLFEKKDVDIFKHVKHEKLPYNSIRRDNYYPIYFELFFGQDAIKFDTLKKILKKDWSFVLEYLKSDLFKIHIGTKPIQIFDALRIKFKELISTKKILENSIRLLMFIESIGVPIPKDLFSQFLDFDNKIIRNNYRNKNELKRFVKDLFLDPEFTHNGRSNLLSSYTYANLNGEGVPFILTPNDIISLNAKIFDDYLKNIKLTNNKLIDLYYKNYFSIDQETRRVTLSPKVSKLLQKHIEGGNYVGYFNLLTRPAMYPNHFNKFVFEPFAGQIFGSIKNFKSFLESVDDYEHKKVLLGYYDKFSKNNFIDFGLDEDEIKQAPDDFINMFPDNDRHS